MKLNAELIYGFAGSVLSQRFDEAKRTPECHLEWWDLCCSDEPFVAIAAPRGHAKSTTITHCYTLASVLFKDRRFVIIVSDTYEQSVLFLKDIYTELIDNEALEQLFGKITFEKEAENDIIAKMIDGTRFRIIAKGSEQKIRGIKWDGMRPDLIVCDDLENDEIVLNKERREKFKKWFTGALLPCRSDRGIVRVVGTILHMDSLLENLMPQRADRKYTVDEGIKVVSLKKRSAWLAVKYRAHTPLFEQILWPEKWPRQKLEAERAKYVAIGNPEGYSQEYLNEPIDETRAYFRKADLIPYGDEAKKFAKRMYMAVDFAITETERSDYTVMVVGGMDEQGFLYIVDVLRDRMDGKEIIDNMFNLNKRYSPDVITVEAGAIEKALGPFLNAEMYKRGEGFLNLLPLVPTKDKQSRARSIQARMRAGGVRFDKEAEWYPELEQELLTFPRSVHDDQVDALAWLGLTLDRMIEAPTKDEDAEEEYYEKVKQSGQVFDGRDSITGY